MLKGKKGNAHLQFPSKTFTFEDGNLINDKYRIIPTLNGIAVFSSESPLKLDLQTEEQYSGIRKSSKSFAIMNDEFDPFLTVSTNLFAFSGNDVPSLLLKSSQKDENTYTFETTNYLKGEVCIEINMHEPKLLLDTTVESKNPDENNAYGSVACIGKTEECGIQWLYIRPDFSKMNEMYSANVIKAYIHFPHISGEERINIYTPESRFCSLGTTWNNKKGFSDARFAQTVKNGSYLSVDITELIIDPNEKNLKNIEGMILKPVADSGSAAIISTGDNGLRPIIIEFKYLNRTIYKKKGKNNE